jgi:uncharacterized protein
MREEMRNMDTKKILHIVTYLLIVVGAVNWGFVGLLKLNLVTMLFGTWPMLEQLVYIAVGLAAIYDLATHMGYCRMCGKKK